jgi:hypothetical protein
MQAKEELKRRGVNLGKSEEEDKAVRTARRAVESHLINLIAAALRFNDLSLQDGYDAFDVDDDGKVSLSDLQAAVSTLSLGISEDDCKSLFEGMSGGKGHIERSSWVRTVGDADQEKVQAVMSSLPRGQCR